MDHRGMVVAGVILVIVGGMVGEQVVADRVAAARIEMGVGR